MKDDDPAMVPLERQKRLQRFYQYLRDTGRAEIAEKFDQILNAPIKRWEDRTDG